MKDKLIECPHCNFIHEDSLDYIETGDMEGQFPMDCGKCGEVFQVEFTTTITFKTKA
ncbi:hypothetical protein [Paenibacillus antarcticus]|uniref:hypothetical protein n=1 Tax=Paenibacillus antarcticus TaxID=253703 RepID=UPI000A623DBB|nr:hypothetical protein [Paenibacillus antarcticus]